MQAQPRPPKVARRTTTQVVRRSEPTTVVTEKVAVPKKRKISRRSFIPWLLAIGGIGVYELAPHIPQAVDNLTRNVEKEIEDAFNKGLAQGIAQGEKLARKEIIGSLETIEGTSLTAAMDAAKLLRLCYDTFVSPIVTLAATVTGDFLGISLQAISVGRGFLSKFGQDNTTLAAIQTMLETWLQTVNNVPKKIQTIADSDLDGAQAYLRALQRKINDEKAKLAKE